AQFGQLLSSHAALVYLQLADQVREKRTPLPTLLGFARACIDGEQPLALLERLLAELSRDEAWNKSWRARLKILLTDAMFSAGVGLRDLPDLALAYASLGAILNI